MFSTFENSILEVEKLCRLAVVDELLPQIEPPWGSIWGGGLKLEKYGSQLT